MLFSEKKKNILSCSSFDLIYDNSAVLNYKLNMHRVGEFQSQNFKSQYVKWGC